MACPRAPAPFVRPPRVIRSEALPSNLLRQHTAGDPVTTLTAQDSLSASRARVWPVPPVSPAARADSPSAAFTFTTAPAPAAPYGGGSPERPAKRRRHSLTAVPLARYVPPLCGLDEYHALPSPGTRRVPHALPFREDSIDVGVAASTAREVSIHDDRSAFYDEDWAPPAVALAQPLSDAETSGENGLRRTRPAAPRTRHVLTPIPRPAPRHSQAHSVHAAFRPSLFSSASTRRSPPPAIHAPSSPDVAELVFDLSALGVRATSDVLDGMQADVSTGAEEGPAARFAEGAAVDFDEARWRDGLNPGTGWGTR
ncbi:hypothetical protein JCM3770_001899 [Rhodotorula araucariae]